MIPRAALAVAVVVLGALIAPGPAAAEWVKARGEHLFGPNVSEAEACLQAERKAKENAIKAKMGERLSSENMMVCEENADTADCRLNQTTWSMIDGAIAGVRNITQHTETAYVAFHKCIVELEADVRTAEGRPDPNFDIDVKLNAALFKEGDTLVLHIAPTKRMYLSVFQWLPYETKGPAVSRLFPNPFDLENDIRGPITVPTTEGRKRYDMTLGFPESMPNKRMVDEYLLVVGTKDHIEFRDSYSLEDFNARMLEIPRDESRIVKRAYAVVRAK